MFLVFGSPLSAIRGQGHSVSRGPTRCALRSDRPKAFSPIDSGYFTSMTGWPGGNESPSTSRTTPGRDGDSKGGRRSYGSRRDREQEGPRLGPGAVGEAVPLPRVEGRHVAPD